MRRISLLIMAGLLVAMLSLSACSSGQNNQHAAEGATVTLAPVSALPPQMQAAPARVRQAYQFAVSHPDALRNVPCYCGCGPMGHKSNLACYIQDGHSGGTPAFDDHALGCSLCVDITLDVMRMTGEGKAPADIRAEIVSTYSKFGPSNQ
jgi:hypothetical protein